MKVETSCRSVRLSAPACSIHKQITGAGVHITEGELLLAAARPRTLATLPADPRQSRDGVIEFATAHWLAWYHGSAELIGLQIK